MLLIALSLGILIFLSLFCVIAGAEWDNMSSTISFPTDNIVAFNIDIVAGAIIIIIIVVSVGVIVGIRIWDSGLSDSSVKILTYGSAYIGVWALFSAFAYPLIIAIEIFGTFIYIVLTIMYALGVIMQLSRGG